MGGNAANSPGMSQFLFTCSEFAMQWLLSDISDTLTIAATHVNTAVTRVVCPVRAPGQ